MKHMKKPVLMPDRSLAHRWMRQRLYYWTDRKLYGLLAVCVMPLRYHRWLYYACLWLVEFRKFRRLADWAILTIPYHIRFDMV